MESFRQEVWSCCDFPEFTKLDEDIPITSKQYYSLKRAWLGKPVKTRDPRVTDDLLRTWGMTSWKQYVLDRYLTNY